MRGRLSARREGVVFLLAMALLLALHSGPGASLPGEWARRTKRGNGKNRYSEEARLPFCSGRRAGSGIRRAVFRKTGLIGFTDGEVYRFVSRWGPLIRAARSPPAIGLPGFSSARLFTWKAGAPAAAGRFVRASGGGYLAAAWFSAAMKPSASSFPSRYCRAALCVSIASACGKTSRGATSVR